MIHRLVLLLWSLCHPLIVLVGAPFWLLKMGRRGGWGSGLAERVGVYGRDAEFEKVDGIYIHAVSVGEVLLALKVIETWREETGDHFILVPTTATGMAVAREKTSGRDWIRVIYAPLDFGFLIRRVMKRFEPRLVVMVESELWPHLIEQTHRLGIPLGLMNARLSPRSGRRLERLRAIVSPFLALLDRVAVPERGDLGRWERIGVRSEALVCTGNVKFDPSGSVLPQKRPEFAQILAAFPRKPIAMAVSTFTGEEEFLDAVFREAGFQSVIVPRHAERRDEVVTALGGRVILRSRFHPPRDDETLVIDSTGELRDWTAHADIVVIGKSFRAVGGQNPTEAILAGIPVICGPRMDNFEPLVSELRAAGGIIMVHDREELLAALRNPLPGQAEAASRSLAKHTGAVRNTVAFLSRSVCRRELGIPVPPARPRSLPSIVP